MSSHVHAALIRKDITKLSEYMIEECVFDIKMFSEYVKAQMKKLSDNDQGFDDILEHVFDAFEEVPDEDFKVHQSHICTEWEAGLGEHTLDSILLSSVSIYNNHKKCRKWNQPTEE